MKNLYLVFFISAFLGCAGIPLQEPSINALAYGSGKFMAITIPDPEKKLSAAWADLMKRSAGNEMIPAMDMILFYNRCVSIISGPVNDPYGLIGDLSVILMLYAAEFDSFNGEMLSIDAVPMETMRFFEAGYISGRGLSQ